MNEQLQAALTAAGHSIVMDADTGHIQVRDEALLRAQGIDALMYLAVFGPLTRQPTARWLIWETAQALGIHPASIHDLYSGRGHDRMPHAFSTPAMNLRAMSYDIARAAFRAALKGNVGAFMFELSRGEMAQTEQRPAEYTSAILAAAIKEGFRGPVFLQGDHFQVNARAYIANTEAELSGLRTLIHESLHAGFYNFELDTSTLVDLSKPTLAEQQWLSAELCAMLSDYIRTHQPPRVTVSIGGEIGEVGDKNSDVHELRAFMDHYRRRIHHHPGLSKLSVHAGTTPGGLLRADGTLGPVVVDFAALKELSNAARREYAMGGVVLHGGSTLPPETLHRFVQAGAIEVHLATAFQNLLFEMLPASLVSEMDAWLLKNAAHTRAPGDTQGQFLYKTRRLVTGPFKKQMWYLPEDERAKIREAFEKRFAQLYAQLGVERTVDTITNVAPAAAHHKRVEDFQPMSAPTSRTAQST
jgi:fructose/tagatose bisphosphate aldolase